MSAVQLYLYINYVVKRRGWGGRQVARTIIIYPQKYPSQF